MNIGLLLAIVSGFLWSVTNVIDKTLVTRYFPNPKLLFVPLSLAYVVIGGTVLLIKGTGLTVASLGYAACASLANVIGNVLYYYTAKRDDISRIVPLFALSTVFVVIAGAIVLGEFFPLRTYAGVAIIIVGALLIMLRSSLRTLFQSRALGYMLIADLMVAVSSIVIKYLTDDYSYWTVFGWIAFFNGLIGLIIFGSQINALRREISRRGWRGVSLIFLSNGNGAAASLFFTMAASLWYISLVNAVSLIQYIFVFIWSVVITKFKPSLFSEALTRRIAWQKIVAILCIIGGVLLVS